MGQVIKVKLIKQNYGDIDFEHVNSELDVVEAVEKGRRSGSMVVIVEINVLIGKK